MPARSAPPNRKGRRSDASATARGWTSRAGGFDGLAGLQAWTDARLGRPARPERICPATGLSVAASWEAEKPFLRPLPALLPEPFDLVKTAPVHKDCTVHFEGRSYVVPFTYVGRTVEVRGCSGRVQILDPQTAAVLISLPAAYARSGS